MARDDDPDADGVDFVVGADDASVHNARDRDVAGPGHDGDAPNPLPPWLRKRAALAGGAAVLIVLALASRAFAARHQSELRNSPTPSAGSSASSSAVNGSVPTLPPATVSAGQCQYRLQPVTVHTLPGRVTAALAQALPGVQVQATSTQLGHASIPGPCVVQREIIASVGGVPILVDVHPFATGDKTDAGDGPGSSGINFYADVVRGSLTVHVSASQPYSARGSKAINSATLSRLAADPRLSAA